ncbi:MAG: ATP-binding protein [Symploca sp. SIO3E6]|nr:ATP-binding protein [Caldora sp. SIO3E6]
MSIFSLLPSAFCLLPFAINMYLSQFRLFHYKSFFDSELLEFKPGINIIVGQNNSGKTALLEALTLSFTNEPHRSLQTLPTTSSRIRDESRAEIVLTTTTSELLILLEQIEQSLHLPLSNNPDFKAEHVLSTFNEWLHQNTSTKICLSIPPKNGKMSYVDIDKLTPLYENLTPLYENLTFGLYNTEKTKNKQGYYECINIIIDKNTSIKSNLSRLSCHWSNTIPIKIFSFFRAKRIYRFYAERLNVGCCPFGDSSVLKPDASNLPEVLNALQGSNPERFNRFNQYVSVIFPQVTRIAILTSNSMFEIRVWSVDPKTERDDLSFPLSACGTGIGQVLAILYIVLTSNEPRTIIIDEPQSFLHPGAAKKLIGILREFPQHQYFIATHSPMIIAAANPSTIVKLGYEDGETKTSVMNSEDINEQRSLLTELGVSLSDIFGADNILWVEGATEQECFPLILEKVANKPLRGTQIIAMKNTGDLEGKRAHIIFDIYDKLSGSKSLLPPTIGFVFDREQRSEQEMKDLQKRCSNPVEFLPRRMYENYLLHPEAIAAVINKEDKYREVSLTRVC